MRLYLPWRIRPPTESEMSVLFRIIVAIFVGFGFACLSFGYRAPAERAQEAAGLIRGGYGFIAFGVAIWAIRRFLCGYSD